MQPKFTWAQLDADLERYRQANRAPRWHALLTPLRIVALFVVPMLVALLAAVVLLWVLPMVLNPYVLLVGLLMVAGALGLGYTYK